MELYETTGLKQIFQSMIPSGQSITEGIVISENPIEIMLVNDSVMVLSEKSLIISKGLTNYEVEVEIQTDKGIKTTTIKVKNALKKGEYVILLSLNNNKQYYILDRKG